MTTQTPANVTFAVTNDWGNGFTADLTISNTGTTAINGWTLVFDAPYPIDQNWSSSFTKLADGRYSFTPLSWNTTIPAGGTVTFGFRGAKAPGTVAPAPTNYLLNGASLGSLGTTTTTTTAQATALTTVTPDISIGNVTVAENSSKALFKVSLSQASTSQVTVDYLTQGGTAIAGQDFTAAQGKLTFAPGETSKTIAVPIIKDSIFETAETFKMMLSNATQAKILQGQGNGTINDNDLAKVDFKVTGDWGDVFTADLTIRNLSNAPINGWNLSFKAPYTIDQNWSSVLTSPQSGTYTVTPLSWNQSIPAGGTVSFGFRGIKATGTVAPAPTDYKLNGITLDSAGATSPPPPALPSLTISDTTMTEGALNANGQASALFTVKLSQASTSPVTVNYATQNGTATAGQDFTAAQGTLTFAAGETSKTIAVPILNDTLVESSESFNVVLSGATQATILDGTGVGTILDNDVAAPTLPTMSIGNATLAEGALNSKGAPSALFTVSLSKASTSPVTVGYATQNGTAVAGQDFTAAQGTLTFAAGETSKTIAVPILNDTLVEQSETFKVLLSSPTQATILNGTGTGTILDNDVATPPPSTGKFNYGEALQKSFLFYEAQRSGKLPATNRIEWRGDSALGDGSDVGRDLTGGYYDAGDHVKFGLPMTSAMTMLSWGVKEYREGYSKMGQLDEALDAIRWGTDYILKCNVTDANGTKEFYGQVGDGNLDHSYWGSPEAMTMARPAYKVDRQHPGSDLAGEAAAALASASIVFRQSDATYADKLLNNAIQLYNFADTYRGTYLNSVPAANFYASGSGYQDELAWGAAWVHEALQAAGKADTTYLAKAEANFTGLGNGTQSWDNKSYGTAVLLAQDTGKASYKGSVENWLNYWQPGGGVTYTAGGLAWNDQWGSLRYAANTAFIGGVYADTVNNPNGKYSQFSQKQIDYILGDNPRNSSYMVGFGNNSPVNPHHRAASGTDWSGFNGSQPNAHILYGALVGGPSAANDFAYQDVRSDYVCNEVALDYNAAFTGALARMANTFGGTPLTDAQLDALPGVAVHTAPATI